MFAGAGLACEGGEKIAHTPPTPKFPALSECFGKRVNQEALIKNPAAPSVNQKTSIGGTFFPSRQADRIPKKSK